MLKQLVWDQKHQSASNRLCVCHCVVFLLRVEAGPGMLLYQSTTLVVLSCLYIGFGQVYVPAAPAKLIIHDSIMFENTS